MTEEWAHEQTQKFAFDFDQADTDKSGSLSKAEVLAVLKTVGFKGTDSEGLAIFSHYDSNDDRKVSRDEFTNAMKALPKLTMKEFVLRKAFKQLDKDGSGKLSREELIDATKADGVKISAERISEMIISLIRDEDKMVDYEEFLATFGLEGEATVMGQVFNNLDTDNTGYLTKDEIMAALSSEAELKLKKQRVTDLMNAMATDADQKINYKEFVAAWLKTV